MARRYKASSARPGKSFQANPVIGCKKRTKRPRTWFGRSQSANSIDANDDIPEPLPDGISRGSLYVEPVPVPVVPVPLADMELPYCVPNAKKMRRAIRAAQGIIEPRKTIRRKNPMKKPRSVKRAPVAAPVDRAAILAELRSRKVTR